MIKRFRARQRRRGATPTSRAVRSEAGFTLLELLVVLVIIPLILGAIAMALIVSFNNQAATSNRLSDSVNAQVTSLFFQRDVQGASYVTTSDNANANLFSYNSPEVCGPTPRGTFLVGLYHPPTSTATASSTGLNVGYWANGTGSSTEIDRYSCTASSSTGFAATLPVKTVIATGPPGVATGAIKETISAAAEVTPAWLGLYAQVGWTPVVAQTIVSSAGTIHLGGTGLKIGVASTFGFTVGHTATGVLCAPSATTTTSPTGCSGAAISITTTTGTATVTCAGFDPTNFTNCSGGAATDSVPIGASATQSSISGVQLSLTEPASNYRFSLLGTPVAGSAALTSSEPGGSGPVLLTLGNSGINPINGGGSGTCPDGNQANVCLQTGSVFIDGGGTAQCNGQGPHNYIDVNGGGTIGTVAPPGLSSCNGVNVVTGPGIPNPLRSLSCFNPSSLPATLPAGTTSGGISYPGIYSGSSKPSGKLAPGIYVVENGIGTITGMAPNSGGTAQYYNGDPNAGVLLMNPGPETGTGCLNFSGAALGGSVAGLVPFDLTQSNYWFGNPLLSDVWLWQDALNTTTVSTTGNTTAGLAYLPAGTFSVGGNGTLTTGSMIAGTVDLNGTVTLVLTGQ
jgi:prepilin-type N-terminal cleavage/methylation domain-containing protein